MILLFRLVLVNQEGICIEPTVCDQIPTDTTGIDSSAIYEIAGNVSLLRYNHFTRTSRNIDIILVNYTGY